MKVVAVWTVKGGVGKTAAAVNLAHAAAATGRRTLLWDLDPQGAASFYLRVAPRLEDGVDGVLRRKTDLAGLAVPTEFDNLWLIPADFELRHLDLALDDARKPRSRLRKRLTPLAGRFDVALLDCPPSVSLVTEAVLRAADAVLAPVVPTTLSLRTLEQVRRLVNEAGGGTPPAVLPFLSMVDRRKRLHLDTVDECLFDAAFLRTTIPSASAVERMGVVRAPVAATLPSQPSATAFAALWAELADRLG